MTKNRIKILRSVISFFSILFISVAAISLFAWHDYNSGSYLKQETTVILPKGSGFAKAMDILDESKVIAHPLIVKTIAYMAGDARRIKAGEYRFPAGASPRAIMQMLVQGQVVVHKVTVAEGLSVREVLGLLYAEPVLEGYISLPVEEGSLMPETYYFTYGDTRGSLIKRMQEKMNATLTQLWEKRKDNLPFTDIKQALILASIVEKETGVAQERPRIAAVFINRLRLGMKLQSDPTTVYGLEQLFGKKLDRPLTNTDLKTPTPYNTYVIDGLPPTPISNPGKEAIEATLHPLETDELYFVATGNGGHNFSSTLEEHEKNVKKYRQNLKH
jgi:UPF0755 protein